MYQPVCFFLFLAKHKELLNLTHFHFYQPLDYFEILFIVNFLYLRYKIIVWENTLRHIKDSLNQRIYCAVFLVCYFCVSGCFITFSLTNLCYLSLQWITRIYCCSLPPVIWSYQILLSLLSVFWRNEKPWYKITNKLYLECACTCLYLFRSRKKLLVSFFLLSHKWYRDFFQAVRSQQPLFFQCSGMSVLIVPEFLYKCFGFLSPPEVGTKVIHSVILLVLLSTAVFLWEKRSSNVWKNTKMWMLSYSYVCFYIVVSVVILE